MPSQRERRKAEQALGPQTTGQLAVPRAVACGWRLCLSTAVLLAFLTGFASPGLAHSSDGSGRPAVAAMNARVSVGYAYSHVDDTEASVSGSGTTSSLRFDEFDGHGGGGEIVATVPVLHFLGARARLRASHRDTRRSLDALDNDESDVTAYGAGLELLVRDPELGSLAVGGGWDRLDGDGSENANAYSGSVDAAIYFPDMGSGHLDWFARFDFSHREVSGAGRPFDIDADVYRVAGGAGWYVTENLQVRLGGRWTRTEEEFLSEVDTEGFLKLRWKLPLPISLELSAGGSAGVSEYKESPFDGDDRLIYGAQLGLVYRFGSAATLLESIRAYD